METFVSILKNFDLVPFDVLMIAIWAVLFVLLWQVLGRFFFAPFLALTEAREAATTGAESGALEVRSRAEETRQEYDRKIVDARVHALKQKMELVQAAKDLAAKILDKAEAESQEILRAERWEIAQKVDSLRLEAFREADQMASLLVEKLKRPATPITTRTLN
jgi:F0F1-type ATP synthase membrane subunit b/b'